MVNSSEKPQSTTAKPAQIRPTPLGRASQIEQERYQPILDEYDRLEETRLGKLQEEAGRDQKAREQRVIKEHNQRIAKLLKENPGFPQSEESEEQD